MSFSPFHIGQIVRIRQPIVSQSIRDPDSTSYVGQIGIVVDVTNDIYHSPCQIIEVKFFNTLFWYRRLFRDGWCEIVDETSLDEVDAHRYTRLKNSNEEHVQQYEQIRKLQEENIRLQRENELLRLEIDLAPPGKYSKEGGALFAAANTEYTQCQELRGMKRKRDDSCT